MNRCERESEVVSALRVGSLSAELIGHLRGCASCAETERVASALLQSAAAMRVQLELPAAEVVWRRVQARSRELAVKRAARPIIFMRVLSFVYVAVCGGWLLRGVGRWLSDYAEQIARLGLRATGPASFAVAFAAFAALAVGSAAWYLLHESKRSGGVVPSA